MPCGRRYHDLDSPPAPLHTTLLTPPYLPPPAQRYHDLDSLLRDAHSEAAVSTIASRFGLKPGHKRRFELELRELAADRRMPAISRR